MKYTVVLVFNLVLVWMAASGHYTIEKSMIFVEMILSILLVVYVSRKMGIVDGEAHPLMLGFRPFTYLPWLFKEIIVANLTVTKIILSPNLPISPTVIKLKPEQKTSFGRAIYANSITLTPGTISLLAEGKQITVHSINEAGAKDLEAGEMGNRVCKLEGSK